MPSHIPADNPVLRALIQLSETIEDLRTLSSQRPDDGSLRSAVTRLLEDKRALQAAIQSLPDFAPLPRPGGSVTVKGT